MLSETWYCSSHHPIHFDRLYTTDHGATVTASAYSWDDTGNSWLITLKYGQTFVETQCRIHWDIINTDWWMMRVSEDTVTGCRLQSTSCLLRLSVECIAFNMMHVSCIQAWSVLVYNSVTRCSCIQTWWVLVYNSVTQCSCIVLLQVHVSRTWRNHTSSTCISWKTLAVSYEFYVLCIWCNIHCVQ